MNDHRTISNRTQDALAIWQAGVDAVRSERLIARTLQCDSKVLTVSGKPFPLADLGRIAVVGAGKAGAGMALGVEAILGRDLLEQKVLGWVNVPADCVRPTQKIHLHAARPAGVNEPTTDGVFGAETILEIVSNLQPNDLCLVLISGGGSALLPAPAAGISLAEKLAVTRWLMNSGATISELNTVRKHLSRVKGGNLARACRAGRLMTLIISDVVGDPLDIIASGPTVPDSSSAQDALAVLERFRAAPPQIANTVFDFLRTQTQSLQPLPPWPEGVENHVIGNNAVALHAATEKAAQLGYHVISLGSDNQGEASEAGTELAERVLQERRRKNDHSKICLLSGGEPVVNLAQTDLPRKGGRNQQLALAALVRWKSEDICDICLLSGGTDGEDGPTDAAGAYVDADVLTQANLKGLDPSAFLQINDAYHFFERAGGLIKTGPTHTNVMDLRVAVC